MAYTVLRHSSFIACAVLVLFCLPHACFGYPRRTSRGGTLKADAAALADIRTRLRAGRPITLEAMRRGQREVHYLSVEVSNVGAVTADHIEAIAEFPGQLAYQLKGPKRLPHGQRGLYVLRAKVPRLGQGLPRIILRCANCR